MDIFKYAECNDKEILRYAMEVATTFEDVWNEIVKLREGEGRKYDYIISRIVHITDKIDTFKYYVSRETENLENLLQFKNSHIAKLIEDFCKENTLERLDTIRKHIEKDNPFKIIINDHQDEIARNAKRELCYGFNRNNHFHISSISKYYNFNNWDIDDDIERNKKDLKTNAEHLEYYENLLKGLLEKYNLTEDDAKTLYDIVGGSYGDYEYYEDYEE